MQGLINVSFDEPFATELRPGAVCLANEARFTAGHYSEALTNYIVGWRDPNNIEETLNFIAPPVQVGRRFEWKKWDNAEEFYSEADDLRAIGSSFKRVEYKGSSSTDKTLNKGLTIRVDKDEYQDMPGWKETILRRLKQRLLRNELRRAATLLIASATNTNKTWDISAGKDPDQDMLTELTTVADNLGFRSNRILFGEVAWNKRALSHRAQATAGGFASATMTLEQVAGILGVSQAKISRERYQSSASAKTKVVGDYVIFFYAEEGVGMDDPSHLKRFWSPVESGGMWRVYELEVGTKFIDFTIEHYSNVIATSTTGLRKFTVS